MGTHGTIVSRISRASLTAIVVASLLVVAPLVVVASASGRVDGGRASSSRSGPVAHVAFLLPVASFIVNELASNIFSEGFGWVMGQFGEKDGLVDQIGPIRDKLDTIDNRLTAIETATDQLRKELAQVNFNHLAADANNIIGQINYGIDRLNTIADWPANISQADKKIEAQELQRYIGTHLLDKQSVLDLKINPKIGEGLIASAYKVEKSHVGLFWTRLNSVRVREVFSYYQDEEARLLLLRVEYWHATGRSGDFIQREIYGFETMLNDQFTAVVKLRALPNSIADTRTRSDYLWTDLFTPTTFAGAQQLERKHGGGWRLPTEAEVTNLIKGWHGKNWADWINNDIGGQLTVPCCFAGVWTNQYTSGGSLGNGFIAVRANGTLVVPGSNTLMGVLLIRSRGSQLKPDGKYVPVSYW